MEVALVGRTPALHLRTKRYALLDDVTVRSAVSCDDVDDASHPELAPQELSIPFNEVFPHVSEYNSLADALTDGADIDCIDIASPASVVGDALDSALDVGVPTLCTPPLVGDPNRLDAIRSRLSASETWMLNGNPHRFSRFYTQLKNRIEEGAIGTLGVARIKRGVPHLNQGWNAWYVEGGGLMDGVLAYDFDLLTELFGPIERMYARVGEMTSPVHTHVLLRFLSGAVGQVEATSNQSGSLPAAKIECSGNHGRVHFSEEASCDHYQIKSQREPSVPADDCYARMLRAFLDCVHENRPPQSGVTDVLTTTRAVLATEHSAVTGRPVRLAEGEQ